MKLDWGKSIFIFFVLFLSLATVFIIFSFKHRNDLVTDDYYEKGAAYTEQININKRSAIYSDSLNIHQNQQTVNLLFSESIKSKAGNIEAHFYYPADKDKDYIAEFKEIRGSLKISKAYLSTGRCILKVKWEMTDEEYYLEKEIFIN